MQLSELFSYRLLRWLWRGTPESLFQRSPILDTVAEQSQQSQVPQDMAARLRQAAFAEAETLYKLYKTSSEGLSDGQAAWVREHDGSNEVQHEKPMPWWVHLWICYRNPFSLLLSLLALVSWYTGDLTGTIVISSMVVLATFMRFFQEGRSNRAAGALKAMVSNTATVLRRDPAREVEDTARKYFGVTLHPREPSWEERPMRDLVAGDLIRLSAGDMVPADVRVLAAKDLFVSQAALTGESVPVEKHARSHHPEEGNPLEIDTLCFMGTNIVSGTATALVVGTGGRTYFGSLAAHVMTQERALTAFQKGVNRVSWLLIRFMAVMTPIVLVINGLTKHDWLEAALFALSIAVGLTPEMLPMIVTSTLAKGAVFLSRKKVIVKRLDAIQNFGAMNILCTDKTGTLTQDRIFLERHGNVAGEKSQRVLELAYLNSYYQTGLKNLLDVAVLEHADLSRDSALTQTYHKVDEIPFDFNRRRMSVVVASEEGPLLICKGAVEEMISVSRYLRDGGEVVALAGEALRRIRLATENLNREGLRVVAVATRAFNEARTSFSVSDESELVLEGYIAFLDPPKETTAPALAALAEHGIQVKILTGDNDLVTAKICREVGLDVTGMLLGHQVEAMSDSELKRAAMHTTVFAKLSPDQKERIVSVLRDEGHVVGFMGDGINDAPALRAADIGISVDTAVDIAKEAADIILLEKSLMILEEGVIEGRKTFANMLKYIKMTASSNFGNVFSVLVASAFLPFLPMLPLQLLVLNLMYDISQIAIPFDNVDSDLLKSPMRWNPADIGRFMICFGPTSSVFDIVTYAVMWFAFGANAPAHQALFQSAWFIESLMTQTLVVHMIRTQKIPFLQSRAAPSLLIMTFLIMALGVAIPLSPLAHWFEMQRVPGLFFVWLAGILIAYIMLTQAMKVFYSRRWGWQ